MDNEFFMNGGIPPQLQMQYNQQPFSTTWQSLGPSIEIQTTQPPPPNDHFESALSSMVSSPVASSSGVSTDNFLVRELIGKLGNICNTNDFQGYLHESAYNSTNNSCYSTPLSSPPPKLVCSSLPIVDSFGLPAMPGDPGFAERAARFSSFGSRSFNSRNNGADVVAVAAAAAARSCSKLQRVCSSPSLKVDLGSRVIQNVNKNENENENDNDGDNDNEKSQMCKSRENSTISAQNQAVENRSNNRKRKGAVSKGKAPISTTGENSENSNKKRSKSEETEENKEGKEKQKVNEAPKDYIHVRARRGQATDSHSLAERVRREKISERMKLLQDLVPGCNRVTGKALMLDEIINYVQSLQRQVEFLSMKLSTVNPRLELNMDNLLTKDRIQPNCSSLTHPMYQTMVPTLYGQPHQNPLQESLTTLGSPLDPLNPTLNHSPPFQLSSFDPFPNSLSQPPSSCEGDLHNIVQMRFSQNDNGFQAPTFYGTNPAQMKIEY